MNRLDLITLDDQHNTSDCLFRYGVFVNLSIQKQNANLNNDFAVNGVALIDTGCEITSIHPDVVDQLNLVHSGTGSVIEVDNKTACTFFNARFAICFPNRPLIIDIDNTPTAPSLKEFEHLENCIAIVGRDILQHCILTYNGIAKTASLEYPD